MKRKLNMLCAMAIALALLIAPSLMILSIPTAASASTSSWTIKAVSIIPSSTGEFGGGSFQQTVRNFQSVGGNTVNFVIPIYQSNPYATDIGAGYNTPTDSALISGIQFVHSLGMKVQLSIYLENYSGDWRAIINPGDRNTWYQKYGDQLVHFGTIAGQQGVDLYELGAELVDMSSASQNGDNTQRWAGMINRVRGVYHGALTYSANRGQQGWASELPNIGFWNMLDYVGVSAYYDCASDDSVSSLKNCWQNVNNYDITPIHNSTGKPVIFTEVGYRSITGAHQHPWDSGIGGPYDSQEQVNDYQALLEYWNNVGFMQGVDWWWWSPNPNYGGSGNTDYTPQNKPASQTLSSWWQGGGTTNPPPPTSGAPRFNSSASANPAAPGSNQQTTVTASVTDTGDATSGALVDVEIYAGSTRVFQHVETNQSFSGGQNHQYTMSWTPSSSGNYTVKIGVFSGDWSQNYSWNDSAATISVGSGNTPPPTQPPPSGGGVTDIWWPTDGSHVTGVVPFKALVENTDVSQYDMWWKVGTGALVPMYTSTQDWPHKEALVDVSNWNWAGAGPYPITFVSKNKSGTVISQKSIQIFTQ